MADERCPNCGSELPRETGQHALSPSAGVVTCPSCGATVTLEKPGARDPEDERKTTAEVPRAAAVPPGEEHAEEFAGQETVEGVMGEIADKEGGQG